MDTANKIPGDTVYDQILSLFSSAGFVIESNEHGDDGCIDLGYNTKIEFEGIRSHNRFVVNIHSDGKHLQNIIMDHVIQTKFLIDQFKLHDDGN